MSERDRPTTEDEIEVTPEMIEAGLAALYQSDRRFDLDSEIVSRVFRAMSLTGPRVPSFGEQGGSS
jgi:hypothetical protein